jgi:hypothetical protein
MRDSTKDGGPAFPYQHDHGNHPYEQAFGMTLRDYFAAAALQAVGHGDSDEKVARYCYQLADAMLAERAK